MNMRAKLDQIDLQVATANGHINIKVDFNAKNRDRHKEGHFLITKGQIHQKDIITLNVYAPHNSASK